MIPFILLAGGLGTRLCKKIPKQYKLLKEKSILHHVLKSLLESNVKECVLVINNLYKKEVLKIIKPFINEIDIIFALSGKNRQDSVKNAFDVLKTKSSWVAIHDSSRPFFTKKLLNLLIKNKNGFDCVVPGSSINDTIKKVSKKNIVKKTLNRENYKNIGTPQIVNKNFYKKAIKENMKIKATDDASFIEAFGGKVCVVKNEEINIKITTKLDFFIAEMILRRYYAYRYRV